MDKLTSVEKEIIDTVILGEIRVLSSKFDADMEDGASKACLERTRKLLSQWHSIRRKLELK